MLKLLAGSANEPLAESVASRLSTRLADRELRRFPDGELHVEVRESVRGADTYLLQPTGPPTDANLLELLMLADACRRAGAARLTAVVPYLGYARQDRRATGREPVVARLVADLARAAGIDRAIAVDLHSAALEGFFAMPLEHLSAVPTLAAAVQAQVGRDAVVVAPDLGAARLADYFGELLGLPVAIVHKIRRSGQTVGVRRITGDVQRRTPVIVDDMISTGGTIEAAAQALLTAGCSPTLTVVASHALLVGSAVDRLASLPLQRLVVTDSLSSACSGRLPVEVVGLAPLLADAIGRLYRNESLDSLIAHR
ncbi:MAG: ribose-phosphate pyrophosphokinase [Chloroflexi bacterium]|nr:ribose-phosphate pyrophosphokinase [Chloroflexota bacterium]